MSVVQVENEKIYDNGIPTDGGINDLRMGTMDKAMRCSTCQGGILLRFANSKIASYFIT